MAFYSTTGALLYHRPYNHQHHQPFPFARSRYLHPRRSTLSSLPFARSRLDETLNKRETLPLTLRSVQCLKQEEQAGVVHAEEEGGASLLYVEAQPERSDGDDAEVVDWVNSADRDPMVEVDPVTVSRRIVSERQASLAMAIAVEDAALLVQTTSPPPFFPSSKRPSNFTIAIATALVLLALAAALYFSRSRKNSDNGSKLTLTNGNDTLGPSIINGRRKLVKNTIKASQSLLTAMEIGAASLGRPKANHETSHAVYGNAAVDQTGDTQFDTNGSSSLQHTSSGFGNGEDFKDQNVGVDDVTEGPWFGQAAIEDEPVPAGKEKLEYEAVLAQSQGYQFTSETATLQVVEQSVSEMPASKVLTEPLALTNVVEGEFFGEVLSVNTASEQLVEPNHASIQIENPKSEEIEGDAAQSDSGTNIEKIKQIMEQNLTMMPGSESDALCLDQGLVVGPSDLDLVNVQTEQIDSDIELVESKEYHAIDQLSTTDQANQITEQRLKESKDLFEDVNTVEGDLSSQYLGFAGETEQGYFTNLSFSVDQNVEIRLEQELGDTPDGEGLAEDSLQMGHAKEGDVICGHSFDQGLVGGSGEQQLTEYNVSLSQINHQESAKLQNYGNIPAQPPPDIGNRLPALEANCSASDAIEEATEKVSERGSSKALEAAVPALVIGVGTVGTLLGVAGGLQVVGFAALASLISREFLWAQSRDSLWQELSGITDRQKLLEFLAKRKIMEQEN